MADRGCQEELLMLTYLIGVATSGHARIKMLIVVVIVSKG